MADFDYDESLVDSWLKVSSIASADSLETKEGSQLESRAGLGFKATKPPRNLEESRQREALAKRLKSGANKAIKKRSSSMLEYDDATGASKLEDGDEEDDSLIPSHGLVEDYPLSKVAGKVNTVKQHKKQVNNGKHDIISHSNTAKSAIDQAEKSVESTFPPSDNSTKYAKTPSDFKQLSTGSNNNSNSSSSSNNNSSQSHRVHQQGDQSKGDAPLRKRTKTRSKQKNIRRDNRSDFDKPRHLRQGLPDYKGRPLTDETKKVLGISGSDSI